MSDRILKVPVESAYDINNITDNKRTKVTMYVYALPKLNDAKYFMGEAVQTFLNYSTAPLDRTTVEAYGDEQITLMVANMEGSAAVGNKGKQLVSYATLTSKQWVKHNLAKIELGENGTIEPLMVTINKPFTLADYQAGKQLLFIVSNVDIIKEASDNPRVIDPEGEYNIELTNIEAFKAGSKFSQITPYLSDNLDKINSLSVVLPNYSPFQRINGKGVVNGKETDLSFTTTAKLMPFKQSPISTDQNLSVFADWFDYDLAMPLFIAKLFATPQPLSVLKNIKIGTQAVIDDVEIQCIIDMLAQSVGFSNSWADIARYTGSEANDAGKGNAGRLLSYTTIGVASQGRPNIRISSLEGADPVKSIDGIYESYLRNNVNKEGTLAAKTIKQILAALSRFIYSSYAIGKGQNSFNKIYLPWTLKPLDALVLSNGSKQGDGITAEKQYILSPSVKFQLESNYFKVGANSLDLLSNITNISEVKVIQTDRKITLPTIPLQVQALTKLPLAGDIDTTSDKDLRYFTYIPLNDTTAMAKFMANDATGTTTTNALVTKTFQNYTTPPNPNPIQPYSTKTQAEITAIVKADVMSKYAQLGINENNITFNPATVIFPTQQGLTTATITNNNNTFTNISNGKRYTMPIPAGDPFKATNTIPIDAAAWANALFDLPITSGFSGIYTSVISGNNVAGDDYGYSFLTITDNGRTYTFNITKEDGETTVPASTSVIMIKTTNIEAIQIPSLSIANFPDVTFNIERNTVYNKANWYNDIAANFGVQEVEIPLKEVQNLPITKLHAMTISGFYGDKVTYKINGSIVIEGNNPFTYDETITQFTAIFC